MGVRAPRAHHDGSALYASSLSPQIGETLELRLRTDADAQPETVLLRTVRDGEPHVIPAVAQERRSEEHTSELQSH